MLAVQKYLLNHSLEDLTNEYKIRVTRHKKYPELLHLKYNQIESDFSQQIVKECRALILNESAGYQVVARGYDKFWEYDNPLADSIDWETATVYEKLDGSYCCLYWYDNQWNICTTGTPDGGGQVGDFGFTFAELFWKTWTELGYNLPEVIDTTNCFIFELCTPYNRVVVQHSKSRIVLHGARDIDTQQEIDVEDVTMFYPGWEPIRWFPLTRFEECVALGETLDPLVQEGFVICDADFNRIKLKTDKYKALARIKDNMSIRRMIEIIRCNDDITFLEFFPEWRELHDDIKTKYENFNKQVRETYAYLDEKPFSTRKDFAERAVIYPYSGLLFGLLDGRNLHQMLQDMTIQKIEQLLGLKDTYLVMEKEEE